VGTEPRLLFRLAISGTSTVGSIWKSTAKGLYTEVWRVIALWDGTIGQWQDLSEDEMLGSFNRQAGELLKLLIH
jgi:hypothetical protein